MNAASTKASGHVTFNHHTPVGLSHFTGTVSCLSVSAQNGVTTVFLSGRVNQGETAAGAPPAGKGYAFTLKSTSAGAQTFSLPLLTEGQGLGPCAGSDRKQVPVTQGGFQFRSS